MSEDFEFFSNDFNNWNYNEMFIKPDIDPFNNNKKFKKIFKKINFSLKPINFKLIQIKKNN